MDRSAILKQDASFLGTRIRSTELGKLQSILALTKRQYWVSEPMQAKIPVGISTGWLPSALSKLNSHHTFCQFLIHMLSKLPFKIL